MGNSLLHKSLVDGHIGIAAPAKDGDVGYDMLVSETTVIPPFSDNAFPTPVPIGSAVKIPDDAWGFVVTRSGTNKRGIIALQGVIDSGYTGPLFSLCHNMTGSGIKVMKGERLTQMILIPKYVVPVEHVSDLPATQRGSSGFGSTGGNGMV